MFSKFTLDYLVAVYGIALNYYREKLRLEQERGEVAPVGAREGVADLLGVGGVGVHARRDAGPGARIHREGDIVAG